PMSATLRCLVNSDPGDNTFSSLHAGIEGAPVIHRAPSLIGVYMAGKAPGCAQGCHRPGQGCARRDPTTRAASLVPHGNGASVLTGTGEGRPESRAAFAEGLRSAPGRGGPAVAGPVVTGPVVAAPGAVAPAVL